LLLEHLKRLNEIIGGILISTIEYYFG
jgi:hypothetical protein